VFIVSVPVARRTPGPQQFADVVRDGGYQLFGDVHVRFGDVWVGPAHDLHVSRQRDLEDQKHGCCGVLGIMQPGVSDVRLRSNNFQHS